MRAGDRYAESKGGGRERRSKSKTSKTRVAVGLTIPRPGWEPARSTRNTRAKRADEAGFSSREAGIIEETPFKFAAWKWKEVRKARYNQMVEYCNKTGHSIPTDLDWKDYWNGKATSYTNSKIESWRRAAERVAAMYGHLTIFDIFYEGLEELLNT